MKGRYGRRLRGAKTEPYRASDLNAGATLAERASGFAWDGKGVVVLFEIDLAAGISKRVGFHTFRHTYTTLLTQNNEDVKVVQELLRHANSRITLDLYAQAGMPEKRQAQSKLVERVLRKGKAAV